MSGLSDEQRARLASVLAKHHTHAIGLGEWCCACSPREWRPTARRPQHLADALAPVVAAIADEAAAGALRETAAAWTQGEWSNVMLPKPTPPAVPVIAYSNRVGDWLRERAYRIGGDA